MIELAAGFIAALMRWPAFRALVIQLIIEIMTRDETDPVFREQFLSLTSQLAACRTAEEKRAILVKIKALKRGAPPA